MRRGFLFSILISMVLLAVINLASFILIQKEVIDISVDAEYSRPLLMVGLAHDLGDEFPVNTTNTSSLIITEGRSTSTLSDLAIELNRYPLFLTAFRGASQYNVTLDNTNVATTLGNGILELEGRDLLYTGNGDVFSLNHTSSNLRIEFETGLTANNVAFTPPLPGSGDIATRIITTGYDSGNVFVNRATTYDGFVNFSMTQNMTIKFMGGNVEMDYSDAPNTFYHELTVDSIDSDLLPVFGSLNATTSGTNPGWTVPYIDGSSTNNQYASISLFGTYNTVLVDLDNDTSYDVALIDANNNGAFNDTADRNRILHGSVVDLQDESFLLTFGADGSWIKLSKTMALYTYTTRVTGVSPIRV